MNYQTEEVKIESFWGAIASFMLLQIFGFVLFQAFLFHTGSIIGVIWGLGWLFGLIYFQSSVMNQAVDFISVSDKKQALLSLRQPDDLAKFFATILFTAIFVAFAFGYYPFPKKEYAALHLILFFAFSWVVSFIAKRYSVKHEKAVFQVSGSLLVGFLTGSIFFAIGLLLPSIFYFHGLAGLGFMVMCLTALLLKDQIK